MELIVALALLALFGAWWVARANAARKVAQVANQQTESKHGSTPPTLLENAHSDRISPQDILAHAEPKGVRAFAEIVDPNGGVREISAEEVIAYFQPVRTKLASLRKVAANSTRVAKAFEKSGGPTPHVELYRRAHRDAVALTTETEGLLDIMLFGAEADSNWYDELLERVVDVEMELEENLGLISKVEAQIASGDFLPVQSVRTAKQKSHSAEL